MWVFGGKSNDNDKMVDLWSFDFSKNQWEQVEFTMDQDVEIVGRSGHSASIYHGHMIIFAGIHEVTHELDDMAAFNFKSKKWVHMFKEPNTS
jgi:N-acetylneuraminic acid mutarotase